jgi:hypothetical protein
MPILSLPDLPEASRIAPDAGQVSLTHQILPMNIDLLVVATEQDSFTH